MADGQHRQRRGHQTAGDQQHQQREQGPALARPQRHAQQRVGDLGPGAVEDAEGPAHHRPRVQAHAREQQGAHPRVVHEGPVQQDVFGDEVDGARAGGAREAEQQEEGAEPGGALVQGGVLAQSADAEAAGRG
ncbi:MAG: hypothetical protein ACK559_08195, partial [bacterium]